MFALLLDVLCMFDHSLHVFAFGIDYAQSRAVVPQSIFKLRINVYLQLALALVASGVIAGR
jgi:hypothetical protein